MPTVLFSNPPWWSSSPAKEEGKFQLRSGVRAGSRWPFTRPSPFLPDQAKPGMYLPAPIFMQGAAAYVQRMFPEAKVVLRDSIARGESYQKFYSYIKELAPDFFIIESGSAALDHDLKVADAVQKMFPQCRIGIAGPIAKRAHELRETLNPSWGFILGEYEKGSCAFINGASGLIPFNLLTKEEMKTLPFPLFDEEANAFYLDPNPIGASNPELQLWASRGCWAVCNFCSFPATMTNNDPLGLGGRKIRFYDVPWLEAFIRFRVDVGRRARTPLASVRFDGDTENASDKHTLAICEMMKRIGLPWSMMCRADTSSREVWQAMKDSGCFGVKIGFESGVDRIVNEVIKKKLNLKEAEQTAKFLRSIGMSVHGTFMVGHPSETEDERHQTIAFIRRLYAENGINSHQLSAAGELHGTPLASTPHADPNYVVNPDGLLKLEEMAR